MLERLRKVLGGVIKNKPEQRVIENHEVSAQEYLSSLHEHNRKQIEGLISAFREKALSFGPNKVGIIAFGSSVKPESKRDHEPRDIDLRIISSAEPESKDQEVAVLLATSTTNNYLTRQNMRREFRERTFQTYPVEGYSYNPETGKSTKHIVDYLDYSNNDPSFRVTDVPEGSLPLHISISGPGKDSLRMHISEERRQSQYFSVLAII